MPLKIVDFRPWLTQCLQPIPHPATAHLQAITDPELTVIEDTCKECDHACLNLLNSDDTCCLCRKVKPCDTCSDRRDRESERAYESFCEDFYGGSQPVTVEEQYQAAAAQKRRLS